MTIGVFSHYFWPEIGAPSARIGDFAKEWVREGHAVHMTTCFPNHPTGVVHPGYRPGKYSHEMFGGIHVHRNWTYVTPNKGVLKKTLGHLSFWLSARVHTLPRLPAMTCAIGSSPTLFAAMAARDCARRQRIPFIMEVRDLWPAIFRDLGVLRNETALRLLERWEMSLYRSATRVVTVTDSFRDNIIGRGIPAEKVVTITNGADTDFWQPGKAAPQELRSRLGLTGKFVVLYIGAHGISHALSAQLRAAARLKSESNIHFVFVGEGAEKERLQNEARALGLGSVLFRDPVGREEVRDYYAMADLCLVPLRAIPLFDTFIPSKMFEIMSMERPLLASLRGEAARILTRSGAARIVAPEDDEAVAAAIGDLRNKPAELVGMGIAGRRFVESCYSRRMLARRYLELMAEACTGGQADRQAQ